MLHQSTTYITVRIDGSPEDQLVRDAIALKAKVSNGLARQVVLQEIKSILQRAECLLVCRFNLQRLATLDDAMATGKICLALTYLNADWNDLHDSFKRTLISSIYRCRDIMPLMSAKSTLHSLGRLCLPKDWSSLEIDMSAKEVVLALLDIIEKQVSLCDEQMQANILWAITRIDVDFKDAQYVFSKIINKMLEASDQDLMLSRYGDCEINQISDFLANYQSDIPPDWKRAFEILSNCCEKRAVRIRENPPRSSHWHEFIVEPVFKLYADSPFKSEYLIAGGFADICFEKEKVVFEFNGQSYHYDEKDKLNSHSRYRERIMKKCGYRVYQVSSDAWNQAENKHQFVIDLLLLACIPLKNDALIPTVTILNPQVPLANPSPNPMNPPNVLWHPIPRNLKRTYDELQSGNENDADNQLSKYQRIA